MKKANKTARAEESENKATEVKKTGQRKRTGFFGFFFLKSIFVHKGRDGESVKYCDVQYRQNTQSSPASTATLMVQSCWCRQMPQGGAVTVGALTARLLSALLISSVLPQSTRCFLYPDRTVTIQVGPIKTFCTCNDDIRQWKFQTGLVLSPCLIYQPWALTTTRGVCLPVD